MGQDVSKSLSITVYPSSLEAEYLSASDAMRQILDLVEGLELAESIASDSQQIVWRLKEAHTNSPPFTVTVEAFSRDPVLSVFISASRTTDFFSNNLRDLLSGDAEDLQISALAPPLTRVLNRNMRGVGRTAIKFAEGFLEIIPTNALVALANLERLELEAKVEVPDYQRTEFGSVEVEVIGLTRWNDKPALTVIERLSSERSTCVLSIELAAKLGIAHRWAEAWEGRRLLVTGALRYAKDGSLKRVDAEDAEDIPWTDVPVHAFSGLDILQGRSVSEHLALIRGDDRG